MSTPAAPTPIPHATPHAAHGGLWMAVWSLLAREWLRFLRQKFRLIGALGTPLLFWGFFGAGFGNSFVPAGAAASMNYMTYFFPGTVLLVVLFTAIFSSISVIEDRNAGFLQGVVVAPVPRAAIVLGKVSGSATLGFFQGVLVLLLAFATGLIPSLAVLAQMAGILLLIAFGLSALGFLLVWPMDSIQGFHAVMNLVLMPLWFLSGALFPASGAHGWLKLVMAANPLTYGLGALRHTLYAPGVSQSLGDPDLPLAMAVLLGFCLVMLLGGLLVVRRPLKR